MDHAKKFRQELIRSVETLPMIATMNAAQLAERKRQERRAYEARKLERGCK